MSKNKSGNGQSKAGSKPPPGQNLPAKTGNASGLNRGNNPPKPKS